LCGGGGGAKGEKSWGRKGSWGRGVKSMAGGGQTKVKTPKTASGGARGRGYGDKIREESKTTRKKKKNFAFNY